VARFVATDVTTLGTFFFFVFDHGFHNISPHKHNYTQKKLHGKRINACQMVNNMIHYQ